MKHCSTQGDRRFWLVGYLFTVPTLNCFFDFIIYLLLFFYVGVVGDLCSLENWYYRILILMTGFLQNATLAVDALSIWYGVLFSPHVLLVIYYCHVIAKKKTKVVLTVKYFNYTFEMKQRDFHKEKWVFLMFRKKWKLHLFPLVVWYKVWSYKKFL